MELVLFLIVLIFNKSWQQDSTETLNETLERLIEQIDLTNRTKNNDTDTNKNTSKIFYLHPDNVKQSEKETESEAPIIKTDDDNSVSITDILKALNLRNKSADGGKNKIRKEISFTVENMKPLTIITNSTEVQQDSLVQMTSKSGRPAELDSLKDPSSALTFDAEAMKHLLHRYPEIIVNKITYHDDKNKSDKVIEKQVDKPVLSKKDYPNMIAQKLKSIINELQKMNAAETASENKVLTSRSNTPQVEISQGTIQAPCGKVLVPYTSPCDSVMLKKLQGYENLVGTSLKLAWKARNERQNALRTSRAYKIKHIHFIPQMIHNMPRFIHRQLHGYY